MEISGVPAAPACSRCLPEVAEHPSFDPTVEVTQQRQWTNADFPQFPPYDQRFACSSVGQTLQYLHAGTVLLRLPGLCPPTRFSPHYLSGHAQTLVQLRSS